MQLLRNVILAIGLGGLAVGAAFGCGGGSKSEETTPAATEQPAEGMGEAGGEAAPAEGEAPAEGDQPAEAGEQPAESEQPAEGNK